MSGKIREIKLSPHTSDHDMSYRVKWAEGWVSDGDQVKITMVMKGRQMKFKDQGLLTLLTFISKLSDFAVPVTMPKDQGRMISCVLKPKK